MRTSTIVAGIMPNVTEGCVADAVSGVRLATRSEESDLRELTSLAVQGDRTAIESLLAQLRPMVVRYCRARLGRVSGHYHIADDVAQEVCIAVLAALPRYRDLGRPFASFVFGIASHKVADALRSSVRSAVPTQDLPDGPRRGARPGGDRRPPHRGGPGPRTARPIARQPARAPHPAGRLGVVRGGDG
jgi:DNA-directed RNA polymerase specialized sigma subunit, sigma24 homolog